MILRKLTQAEWDAPAPQTLEAAVLACLRTRGPQSRPAIEAHVGACAYAPTGVSAILAALKRRGLVVLLRRGGRYRTSLWGAV